MNFEVNKMAGAVLGSLLVVMGLGFFSDALYAPDPMKKPGYALPAGEHTLSLSYAPRTFQIGAVLTLTAGLLGLLGFLLARRRRAASA